MSVAIVDYGSGNLHSAAKAFERAAREAGLQGPSSVTSDPARVAAADRVVLPGVGAFADCRRGLDAVPGMVEALDRDGARERPPVPRHLRRHAADGDPRPRTCDDSRASAGSRATSRPSQPDDPALKIPHMGWNNLQQRRPHPLLDGIPTGPDGLHAYFVHSYALRPDRPVRRGGAPPTMAARSRPSSPGTTWPARSSIPRKARSSRPQAHRQFPEVAAVILFPAIDLKDGRCVRLMQGDMDQATVFNDDPGRAGR